MVATRGSQGITAPRIPFTPSVAPQSRVATAKKPKTKKSAAAAPAAASSSGGPATAAKPKANTSKPRAKDKTAAGRVAKPKAAKKKAPATKNRRDPSLLDKVAGVAEKVVGAIEGKPGKKV